MCAEPWPTQASQARSSIRRRIGVEYFPWFQASQFIHQLGLCPCILEFCDPKLPGRDVYTGQTNDGSPLGRGNRVVGEGDSCQEMRFPRRKELRINQRPRCIHANDFAAHEALSEFRVLYLLAEGDGSSGLEKFGDVALRGMVGDSTEWNRVGAGFVSRGEGNGKQLGSNLRIFVKHFVEVTDAEQQDGIGIAALDLTVLPHQG